MNAEHPPTLPFLEIQPEGLIITIYVQPRSSRNQITGIHGQALKVKLTAPPVDGAANKMCIEFLSKALQVPKTSIDMLSGQTGRNKRLLIRTDDHDTQSRLFQLLGKYAEATKSP
ncbi:MAG: YggU family protein [Proteobacteria bacterium]|nr:YggU family protein [Pseudomonadota bacterium]